MCRLLCHLHDFMVHSEEGSFTIDNLKQLKVKYWQQDEKKIKGKKRRVEQKAEKVNYLDISTVHINNVWTDHCQTNPQIRSAHNHSILTLSYTDTRTEQI